MKTVAIFIFVLTVVVYAPLLSMYKGPAFEDARELAQLQRATRFTNESFVTALFNNDVTTLAFYPQAGNTLRILCDWHPPYFTFLKQAPQAIDYLIKNMTLRQRDSFLYTLSNNYRGNCSTADTQDALAELRADQEEQDQAHEHIQMFFTKKVANTPEDIVKHYQLLAAHTRDVAVTLAVLTMQHGAAVERICTDDRQHDDVVLFKADILARYLDIVGNNNKVLTLPENVAKIIGEYMDFFRSEKLEY